MFQFFQAISAFKDQEQIIIHVFENLQNFYCISDAEVMPRKDEGICKANRLKFFRLNLVF